MNVFFHFFPFSLWYTFTSNVCLPKPKLQFFWHSKCTHKVNYSPDPHPLPRPAPAMHCVHSSSVSVTSLILASSWNLALISWSHLSSASNRFSLSFKKKMRIMISFNGLKVKFVTFQYFVEWVNLNKLQEIVKDTGAWHVAIHGVPESWPQLSKWTITKYFVINGILYETYPVTSKNPTPSPVFSDNQI